MVGTGIGSALREARERLGWSRETLAHHAGLSCAAVTQIEQGRRTDVRLGSLVALADALAVPLDHLVRRASTGPRDRTLFEHRVLVYDDDDSYLAVVAPFLRQGVERGDAVLAVVDRRLARRLRSALGDHAGAVELHDAATWYRTPAVALQCFRDYIDARGADGVPWIRIVGQATWVGGTEAQVQAWTRYEALVNVVLAQAPATAICPYDLRQARAGVEAAALCTHPELALADGSAANSAFVPAEELLLAAP